MISSRLYCTEKHASLPMQGTRVSEGEQILTVTIAQKTVLKDLCQSKGTTSNEQNLMNQISRPIGRKILV